MIYGIILLFLASELYAQNESYTLNFDIQFNKSQFSESQRGAADRDPFRPLASEIGRRATAYAQQRGSENPLAIVVIAAPEKSAFNTPIYPGVAVFMKME